MAEPRSIPPQHPPGSRSVPNLHNLQKHIKSGFAISKGSDTATVSHILRGFRLSTQWCDKSNDHIVEEDLNNRGRKGSNSKNKKSGVGSPLKTSEQTARWAVPGRETPKSPQASMTELFRLLRIKEADQGPSGSLALPYFQSSTGRSTLPSAQATYLRRGE